MGCMPLVHEECSHDCRTKKKNTIGEQRNFLKNGVAIVIQLNETEFVHQSVNLIAVNVTKSSRILSLTENNKHSL